MIETFMLLDDPTVVYRVEHYTYKPHENIWAVCAKCDFNNDARCGKARACGPTEYYKVVQEDA